MKTPANTIAAYPAIQDVLETGERVEWFGRPVAWRLGLRKWPFAVIGILMLFAASRGLWLFVQTRPSESSVAPGVVWPMLIALTLVFSIFSLVALGLIARPLLRTLEANRICYAITDRRVIIVQRSRLQLNSVHEFRSGDIRRIVVMHGWRGNSDVLLWRGPIDFNILASGRQAVATSDWRSDVGLLAIADPTLPEQLIRQHHLRPDPII